MFGIKEVHVVSLVNVVYFAYNLFFRKLFIKKEQFDGML